MSSIKRLFKIALIQMKVSKDKVENIKNATCLVTAASQLGSEMVVLPECFNSPYGTKYFSEYAETIPTGQTCQALSEAAKANKIYLVGGSIPEVSCGKLYNTCTVWNPEGTLVCSHRKVHLFDIDIPNGVKFKESEVLSAGTALTMFETEFCKVGLAICYDIRFSEMASLYRQWGADLILYPGAFNLKTGPLHWELLLRSRAVDNQLYVAGICAAQDLSAEYIAWGHSMLVNPWGTIEAQAEVEPAIIYGTIDPKICREMREQIPIRSQRRTDLYDVITKSNAMNVEN